MPKKSQYKPGEHPNSRENLTYHEGRPTVYEERKKRREVLVTETGWEGFKQAAQAAGYSASEFVERIGRGMLKISE